MRLTSEFLGSAEMVSEREVVAGGVITTEILYTVGKYGFDDSGNIRIAWRSVSDWEGPQFDDPQGFGFTTVSTTGDCTLHYKKGVHQRPFHNCLEIKVRDGNLKEGDVVRVVLGDRSQGGPGIRVQTFCESEHEYRVFVDPLNICRYEELEEPLRMRVLSGPPAELQLVAPSRVEKDCPFHMTLRVLDQWGNPCGDFAGLVELNVLGGGEGLSFPRSVAFTGGEGGFIRLSDCRAAGDGTYHVEALCRDRAIRGVSNGVICGEHDGFKLFWGDAHGQTSHTIGTGSLDEYFQFAKGPSAIDFTGWQGNDFEISREKWEEVKAKTREYNEPGRFITFLGYEWSGNFPAGGDHNIYYLGDEAEFYPHCNWTSFKDGEENGNNRCPVDELWEEFRGRKDVMAIPHIGGRPGNLDYFNPELTPVIEIHSHHGTFEWFAREAMERGLKVGFIGTSDDHTCRPGLSYPLQNVKQMAAAFDVANGFTAVYAEELTREAIWEAIKKRRVYATTFARIALDVRIGGHYMGEEISLAENPEISVHAVGTAPIESVEVIRGTRTIHKRRPGRREAAGKGLTRVKILWEGVMTTGRRKSTDWDGTVSLSRGKIRLARELAFDRIEQGLESVTHQWIRWHSTTSGDMDGLYLEIEAPEDARLAFCTKQLSFDLALSELRSEPRVFKGGGVNLQASVALAEEAEPPLECRFGFTDQEAPAGMNPYWLKVVQRDGHMAWSSPIFVNRP